MLQVETSFDKDGNELIQLLPERLTVFSVWSWEDLEKVFESRSVDLFAWS